MTVTIKCIWKSLGRAGKTCGKLLQKVTIFTCFHAVSFFVLQFFSVRNPSGSFNKWVYFWLKIVWNSEMSSKNSIYFRFLNKKTNFSFLNILIINFAADLLFISKYFFKLYFKFSKKKPETPLFNLLKTDFEWIFQIIFL